MTIDRDSELIGSLKNVTKMEKNRVNFLDEDGKCQVRLLILSISMSIRCTSRRLHILESWKFNLVRVSDAQQQTNREI